MPFVLFGYKKVHEREINSNAIDMKEIWTKEDCHAISLISAFPKLSLSICNYRLFELNSFSIDSDGFPLTSSTEKIQDD